MTFMEAIAVMDGKAQVCRPVEEGFIRYMNFISHELHIYEVNYEISVQTDNKQLLTVEDLNATNWELVK